MIGFFSKEEIFELGFGSVGGNVKISKTSTLYNRDRIFIGDNVRIDNFCVIAPSGNAKFNIGNYVHISAHSFINGLAEIVINNFVTFSPYVRIFSSIDDYSGEWLTNTTVPSEFIKTLSLPVIIEEHVILGTGVTVMPGVTLKQGTAVGAHSFVKNSSEPFTIIAGCPARKIKDRSRNLLKLVKSFHSLNKKE